MLKVPPKTFKSTPVATRMLARAVIQRANPPSSALAVESPRGMGARRADRVTPERRRADRVTPESERGSRVWLRQRPLRLKAGEGRSAGRYFRGLGLACLLLMGSTLLSWPAGVEAGSNSRSEFSREERRALEAGELVQRPMEKRRGDLRLIGGTSYQLISAPAHVVWQALLDTPHYPRMMPEVLEARLVETKSSQRTVFMRQGREGISERTYYLKVNVDAARQEIGFQMDKDRPHDLRAAWGFYQVRPYGQSTLLVYGIMADIGSGLLSSMFRGTFHEWMLRTPWMMKRFIEGSGRYIYDWSGADAQAADHKSAKASNF